MKNFTVVAASVKNRDSGLASFASYLHMLEHPHHEQKTSKIYPVFGGENTFKNIMLDTFEYEKKEGERRAENGIRGRYKLDSFAHSFMLSVPKKNDLNEHIRPTSEQWKSILNDVISSIYKTIKDKDNNRKKIEKDEFGNVVNIIKLPPKYSFNSKDFSKVVFANIHEQVAGNDHANIVISKLIGGDIVKELTQKAVLQSIKNTFTASLAKHCDLSIDNYKPVRTGRPAKRVSVGQAHSFALKEQLESIKKEYGEEIQKPLRNLIRALEKNDVERARKWTVAISNARSEIAEKAKSDEEKQLVKEQDSKLNTLLKPLNEHLDKKNIPRINKPRF